MFFYYLYPAFYLFFRFAKLNLERGKRGVFEIEDLVKTVRLEKIQDLWVIAVPAHLNLYDYMVVGTCRSQKHLRAASENIRKVFKRKRRENEVVPAPEGKKGTDGWIAMDMGNIALHLFLADVRVKYDLESLWSLGPELDAQKTAADTVEEDLLFDEDFLASLEPDESTQKSS